MNVRVAEHTLESKGSVRYRRNRVFETECFKEKWRFFHQYYDRQRRVFGH